MTFFKDDCNVHNDTAYFKFAKHLVQNYENISLFDKPVCFASRNDQTKWRRIGSINKECSLAESCACIGTFHRRSQDHIALGAVPPVLRHLHVALVEGVTFPQRFRGVKSVNHYDFHSVWVIVDNVERTIHVMNPWKLGVRPHKVVRKCDIQPNLVLRLVSKYKSFRVFYSGGDQVHTVDCRYKCLGFLKRFGDAQNYKTEFNWTELY